MCIGGLRVQFSDVTLETTNFILLDSLLEENMSSGDGMVIPKYI